MPKPKRSIHALQEQLGSTLDRLHTLPVAASQPGEPAGKQPVTADMRGRRTSVNVFDSDLELLEPLRDFLRKKTGVRVIRDSTLIQVLCRCYEPNESSVAAFHQVMSLDQRKKT